MINIVANPVAGKNSGKTNYDLVCNELKNRDIPFHSYLSSYQGNTQEIVAELMQEDCDKLIALGGDGTFSEVLEHVDIDKVKLGLIPSGTGNDFAYASNIKDDVIETLNNILDDNDKKVDFIQIGSHRSLNVCSTGLDIEVLKLYNKQKKKTKSAYRKCLLKVLLNFKFYKLNITIDDEIKLSGEYMLVAYCNGKRFGANILISPISDISDGYMDLILIKKVNRLRIPFALLGFLKGKHLNKSYAEHYRCKHVTVENQDGSPLSLNVDGQVYENEKFDANLIHNKLTLLN